MVSHGREILLLAGKYDLSTACVFPLKLSLLGELHQSKGLHWEGKPPHPMGQYVCLLLLQ